MTVPQTDIAAALRDPARPAPAGLTDPAGRAAGRRFDVYRNNVVASLAAALETAFPAVRRLTGSARFRAIAIAHVRAHPPASPLMMHVGAAFPGWLDEQAPLATQPWLGDVARLECAIRRAYHAADAAPVTPEALAGIPPDAIEGVRLSLAPAVTLVGARWPAVSLWRHALHDAPWPEAGAEAGLVTRPGFDPQVHALTAAGHAFVAEVRAGATLGAAMASAAARDPDFDLAAVLTTLLRDGAVTAIDRSHDR